MKIRGADHVAKASQKIIPNKYTTWIDIYYDYSTGTVMTQTDYDKLADKSHAYGVTQLIRPNTADEIKDTVRRWL